MELLDDYYQKARQSPIEIGVILSNVIISEFMIVNSLCPTVGGLGAAKETAVGGVEPALVPHLEAAALCDLLPPGHARAAPLHAVQPSLGRFSFPLPAAPAGPLRHACGAPPGARGLERGGTSDEITLFGAIIAIVMIFRLVD